MLEYELINGKKYYYELKYTYTNGNDFVGYTIYLGMPVLLVHTDTKYSTIVLREILRLFNMFDKNVIVEIPNDKLLEFWSKHLIVSLIDSDRKLYNVRR